MNFDDLYCPITPRINPHYRVVLAGSMEWAVDHCLLAAGDCEHAFSRLRIPEFVARAYPDAGPDELRIVTDWTIWGFLADDEHDRLVRKPDLLRGRFLEHLEVLRNDVYDHVRGTHLALADLRTRILAKSSPSCLDRFALRSGEWFESMHWEALNRGRRTKPSIDEYLRAREITVGMYTEYALFDATHGVTTSDRFWLDPDLRRLMSMAANIIGWSNDLFSYRKEREIEDPHNLVLLLIDQGRMDEDAACKLVIDMHNLEMMRFLELAEVVHRHNHDMTDTKSQFIAMLHHWIRANIDWAYSSTRYGLERRSVSSRVVLESSPPAYAE